MLTMMVVCRTH